MFARQDKESYEFKNHILASAIISIMYTNQTSARIRDQIIAVLTTFKTKNISLDSEIVQPGYTRTLRQCLNLDQTGKINAIQLVTEYIEGFIDESLKLSSYMKPKRYTLSDLYSAFEFALISEGVLKSDKVFDINNTLKVRLESILNGDNLKYFEVNDYITREDYVKKLFTNYDGSRVQLVNFNLNYVDERFAKVLTKVISKLLLDYAISVDKKENFSVQILLEEAHRYVVNDNDTNIIGYNIFDRITKEGRKYGVILGMITQRPSELSSTALSQCSNYIVLRMFHPSDLDIIKEITHSISENDLEKIKSLGPGSALCFGTAFNMPEFTKIDPPNPYPNSSNAQIEGEWFN